MKTRQEQIEAMKMAIPQTIVAYDMNPKGQHLYGEQRLQIAEELIKAGYGDVSEYKAEIRELKADLDHQIDATNDAENLASHLQDDYDNAFERLKAQEREIERLRAKCEEQDNEIDRLECVIKENDERCFDFPQVKQVQIDVLNEAKEKLDSAPNGWAYTGYIDDLIEEVQSK